MKQSVRPDKRLNWWLIAVLTATNLIAGAALVIGTGSSWWALAEKKDRLWEHGVQLTATVGDVEEGTTDLVTLSYEYRGERLERQFLCRGGGCWTPPGSTMLVWVDPERPQEFLTENGHTDDAGSPRNTWHILAFGCMLLLAGVVTAFVLTSDALARGRQRRGAGDETPRAEPQRKRQRRQTRRIRARPARR